MAGSVAEHPAARSLWGPMAAREAFFGTTGIPSSAGTDRHVVFDPRTRSIWFGTDAATAGRAGLND